MEVWKQFEMPIGIWNQQNEWRQRCIQMWMVTVTSKPLKLCVKLLPSIICWNLWKYRNISKFQGVKGTGKSLISLILFDLDMMLRAEGYKFNLHNITWLDCVQKLENCKRMYKAIAVRWENPPMGYYKLNTDGSSSGNPGNALMSLK